MDPSSSPALRSLALPIRPADARSPVPLYHQVEQDLRRLIQEQVLTSGAVLPAEQDLCQRYGVSRQTMRLALSRLTQDRLIIRHAGRGTFVQPQDDRLAFSLDRSFTRQIAEMGRQARSRVLHQSTGLLGADAPTPLLPHQGARCLHLERLRYGDDEPIGLQALTLLIDRCPGIETRDFSHASVYEVLARDYHLPIREIRHTIGAAVADTRQAALLDVAPGAPLLVVHTTSYIDAPQPIEHTTSHYRADRYSYRTVQTYTPADT
jgi:GntR family transcriptional regulator